MLGNDITSNFITYNSFSVEAGIGGSTTPSTNIPSAANVLYAVDNATPLPPGATFETSTGKITIDTTALVQGASSYTIKATPQNMVSYSGVATGNVSITIQKIPPVMTSIVEPVSGGDSVITVLFNRTLTSVDKSKFLITLNSGTVFSPTVASIANDSQVILTLGTTVGGAGNIQEGVVKVTLNVDAVTDEFGAKSEASLAGKTIIYDSSPPVITTFVGTYDTKQIVLTFDDTLSSVVDASKFTLRKDGALVTISSVVRSLDDKVIITFASNWTRGTAVVTLSQGAVMNAKNLGNAAGTTYSQLITGVPRLLEQRICGTTTGTRIDFLFDSPVQSFNFTYTFKNNAQPVENGSVTTSGVPAGWTVSSFSINRTNFTLHNNAGIMNVPANGIIGTNGAKNLSAITFATRLWNASGCSTTINNRGQN